MQMNMDISLSVSFGENSSISLKEAIASKCPLEMQVLCTQIKLLLESIFKSCFKTQ